MINTILFDLDGTLLPLDMDMFMKIYFEEMGKQFYDLINPRDLVKHIWTSTDEMVKNLEPRLNEEVFMEKFGTLIDGDLKTYIERFDKFYDTGFLKVKDSVHDTPVMRESVAILKEKGYRLVVATNPLFPMKAIKHRIKWAGFEPEDFVYVTCYENNHYCKPQIKFYEEVLENIGAEPTECLMVGNDVQEDLVAGKLGIKTFLIKDYILHRTEEKIVTDYEGNYEDFLDFVKELPEVK